MLLSNNIKMLFKKLDYIQKSKEIVNKKKMPVAERKTVTMHPFFLLSSMP